MKSLKIGLFLVLAAVAFTAAYSRRMPVETLDSTIASGSPLAHAEAISKQDRSEQPSGLQETAAPQAIGRKPRLAVAFRLDPQVTRGLYLGDRWVSPPSFLFAQPGTQYVVHAKLQQIDSDGERIDLSGNWAASNPEMVAIDRRDHGEVILVVRRPGSSRLTVSAGGESKVLQVHARLTSDAMQVEIAQ